MEDYEHCQERAMEVEVCFAIHNVPSPLSGMIQIAAGAVYEEIPYYQCLTPNIWRTRDRVQGRRRNPGFPVKTGIQIHIFLSASGGQRNGLDSVSSTE